MSEANSTSKQCIFRYFQVFSGIRTYLQSMVSVPALRLGNFTIKVVESFKYLGLVLQQNGKWNHHYNYLRTLAHRKAAFLCRLSTPRHPPHVRTIRLLLIANVYQMIRHALPFARLDQVQASALDGILARPLCIGLSKSAGKDNVLMEC